MSGKLIIDLGAHKGEDSDFYLRKGFRVIAVDASAK
ncbi:MAG: FkbM family methyltransferase, partial [Chitinophagaceae bacterium]